MCLKNDLHIVDTLDLPTENPQVFYYIQFRCSA